ncbi:MAG: hypothetical protein RLZZ360_939 [Candidatus Parcubacteria bacterium]|jgi:hypothetical protein
MDVPSKSWHILTITLYSAMVTFVAVIFSWPVPLALFFLCGVPLVVLLYETDLPLGRLLGIVSILSVIVVVLDAVAHTTGSWYTVVGSPWQLLGVTFESVLFAFVHTLYFLVLYEFMFDDTRVRGMARRGVAGMAAVVASLVIAGFYLFSVWLVTFAFVWIIGLLFALVLALMWLAHPGDSTRLVTKAFLFGVMVFPLSLLFELVAQEGDVRLFAFTNEYLFMVPLMGHLVPVEELLLLVLWPTLLVFLYECFVDDGI